MELDTLYKRNNNPDIFYDKQLNLNCGSFALDVSEWYYPFIDDEDDVGDLDESLWCYTRYERTKYIEEMVFDGYDKDDIMSIIIDRDFEFILKTCPWLEPINEEEVYDGGRVIAYRLSMGIPKEREDFDVEACMDFHFRVLIDGEWWEKCGSCPVQKVPKPKREIWKSSEELIYSGPIKYARFKQEK